MAVRGRKLMACAISPDSPWCPLPSSFPPFRSPSPHSSARPEPTPSSDCEAAFTSAADAQLVYTTDPAERLAYSGQTVRLSGSWDPAAWDSLSSAVACVRLDEAFDDVLGASQPVPDEQRRLRTLVHDSRQRPGDQALHPHPPGRRSGRRGHRSRAGTKMHCFEVDHLEDEAPPPTTRTTTRRLRRSRFPRRRRRRPRRPPPPRRPRPATPGGDTPAGGTPDAPFSPDGGGSPVGTPVDTAEAPPASPGSSLGWPRHRHRASPARDRERLRLADAVPPRRPVLFTGLALLLGVGLPRRRTRSASEPLGPPRPTDRPGGGVPPESYSGPGTRRWGCAPGPERVPVEAIRSGG